METNIQEQLNRQEEKINQIYESVEKLRKYFLITMWITLAVIVLPMIGLLIVIPGMIGMYSNMMF